MFKERLPLTAIFLALLLSSLFPPRADAQISATTLIGTVQDTTGDYVFGARIELCNSSGQITSTASTNGEGRFTLAAVPFGIYTLAVEAKGFEVLNRQIAVSAVPPNLALILRVADVRQSVTVSAPTGYSSVNADTGTKIEMPLMETPVSVEVVPAQAMADQQTVNLIDALVNVSGVAPTSDSYGSSDSFSIRGFDGAALLYQDGFRLDEYADSGFTQDMANVESVEVLKGPASVLYGQGEPGGLINVVTKKPGPARFAIVGQQFGPHDFFRTIADGNLPLIADRLGARLAFDRTDTDSFRKFYHLDEISLFPSFFWQPMRQVEVTLRGAYQKGNIFNDNGLPFLSPQTGNGASRIVATASPANVPISSDFIDEGSNSSPEKQYEIRPLATIHIGEGSDLRLAYKFFYDSTNNPPTDEVYLGDANIPNAISGLPPDSLARLGFTETYFHHRTSQVLADLPLHFNVDKVSNKFLIGFDFNKDYGAYDYNGACPAAMNIYAPVYNQPIDYSSNCFLYGYGWNRLGYLSYGAYVQDLVELPHHLFVLGGVRMNWAEAFEDYFGAYVGTTDVHERPTNPRGGVVWEPSTHLSLYSNYASNYGDSALGSNAPGQKFLPPQSADQVEFGAKSEWLDHKLTASTAVYRIIKHNVPAPDPKNPLLTIAIDTARTEGIEFDIAGEVTDDLRVIGGYSNLQDIVTGDTNSLATTGFPSQQGLRFDGIPHVTGSLWATWEPHAGPLHGLIAGGGFNGKSGEHAFQYVNLPDQSDPANSTVTGFEDDRISSSQIVNVMTGYHLNWGPRQLSVQVNIQNLLNRHYFSNDNVAQALPGELFTVMPELEFKF